MEVTKETWRMREQCVPGSLSSSPAQEPGNEAIPSHACSTCNFAKLTTNFRLIRAVRFSSRVKTDFVKKTACA